MSLTEMEFAMSKGYRWLHRFSVFTAGATLFLIFAGAMVSSTGSGLAVPDWPLSYGMLFPPMVGGIFYEHGHRMVATFVGVLTTALAIWLWRREERRWLRNLGVAALAAIVLQGLLGGLTVLYLLPTWISVSHACLAQAFFCLTVGIALFTSAGWRAEAEPMPETGGTPLKWLAAAGTLVVFIQLVLGALMRHTESGLAIPDFPLSFGRLVPPFSELTVDATDPFPISIETLRTRVAVHFAHRAWAGVVSGVLVWTAWRVLRTHGSRPDLTRPSVVLLALLFVQLALGALVIWTGKAVAITTLHVVVGAMALATSLVLTLRVWRICVVVNPEAVSVYTGR
ncbi:MAG: COX15/CtaA family protein [Gemmatimonadota bacterium]|nr:COX15/CtaA family protein [Gemmatimonadota bacterium]